MAPNPFGWCRDGSEQTFCHRYHVWGELPGVSARSKDRKCPLCGGNLSITKADVPNQWIVATCHGPGHCERLDIRNALINDVGIDTRCLGLLGFEGSRRPDDAPVGVHSSRADAATLAAASRWYVVAKIPPGFNGQLTHMVLQAAREHEGDLPADPLKLLPTVKPEFNALASRSGVLRSYKARLFKLWTELSGEQVA